jgi:predicted nucleotidyltransferase component of viral defense system
MFEKVLTKKTIQIIEKMSSATDNFYLAGGTGLALQLGHRKSLDLDFFASQPFDIELMQKKILLDKISMIREGTIHGELHGIKLTFIYYKEPLIFSTIQWKGIHIADWRDITAEKIKTIAQRGAKKDFYDLYEVLQNHLTISEACQFFKKRFKKSGINHYHVLKNLVYFEDADNESKPLLLNKGTKWKWDYVKKFFIENIQEFEFSLLG